MPTAYYQIPKLPTIDSIGGGGTTPQTPYSYNSAYGGKPVVPDMVEMLRRALSGSMANLPQMIKMGQVVDDYTYQEQLRNIMAQDPNYAANRALQSNIAAQHMQGNITNSTKNVMGQAAAERGVARGGILTDADYLLSLGKFAEELQGQGQTEYINYLNSMIKTPVYDVSKNFLNPSDMYNAQLQANMVAAAPDPYQAAMANLNSALSGIARGAGAAQSAPGSSSVSPFGQTAPGTSEAQITAARQKAYNDYWESKNANKSTGTGPYSDANWNSTLDDLWDELTLGGYDYNTDYGTSGTEGSPPWYGPTYGNVDDYNPSWYASPLDEYTYYYGG